MAWYEAHQTLGKHPKTLKLSRLIKRDRRYAVGLLHDFFSWGLDCAKKDGTLPGMNAEDIASALDLSGKSGEKTVAALIESGYLEFENGTYRIHDWYDYAGKLADQREDAKRRKDEWKERKKNGERTVPEQFQNSSGTVPEQFRDRSRTVPERLRNAEGTPLPYPTVPYQNNNYIPKRARPREEEQKNGFEAFWEAYPRKTGGDIRETFLEYQHVTEELGVDPGTLTAAAIEQAKGQTPETIRYFPAATKWLRNRGWEQKIIEVPEQKKSRNVMRQTIHSEPAPPLDPAAIQALVDRI